LVLVEVVRAQQEVVQVRLQCSAVCLCRVVAVEVHQQHQYSKMVATVVLAVVQVVVVLLELER
jgi:hypothetical protein